MITMPRVIRAADVPTAPSGGSGALSLPSEVLDESRRRVSIAASAFVALWSIAIVLNDAVRPLVGTGASEIDLGWNGIGRVAALGGLLVSVATAILARQAWISTRAVVDIGAAFQVLCAALIATIGASHEMIGRPQGMSWICLVILAYPMIAPMPPRRTLVTGLFCAAIDSIAVLTLRRNHPSLLEGGTYALVWLIVPTYLCAFLAVVPARLIARLGRQARRARELGSYTLGELLGRGGMGEVYRAEHRLLARPAAIKLIQPRLLENASPEQARAIVERFHREAEAVAKLRSPHTVSLYDFGMTNDGAMFYVMELLDGLSMEELVLRFGPILEERVIHLLRQLCISLDEAHTNGLIHRDVKPGNIHVCRLGPVVDFVKVLDFGLVKGTEREMAGASNLTAPGMMTGTPAFMGPELFLGSAPDQRADVYAIGCVAYWLLTGRLVYEASSTVELVSRVLTDDPEPPSRFARGRVSPALDALVLRCLAKSPADRPRDAGEVGRLLEACVAAESWTTQRATWWWSAHMAAVA